MVGGGFRPEFGEEPVPILLGGFEVVHKAEASVVREHRPAAIIEMYDDPVMGSVVCLVAVRPQQGPAAGHPKVAHPSGIAIESNQQVLRTHLDTLDPPAAQ